MKSLHRPDLFLWSTFNEARDLDFNALLWVRPEGGNVAIDPLPLSDHDGEHVRRLGGVGWVLISNSDHTRAAADFAQRFGATVLGPAGDRHCPEFQGIPVASWMEAGETLGCGVRCVPLRGSKTPGELAFVLPPGDTVWCGDLVRGQRAGFLNLLPDPKLSDKAAALDSVRALCDLPGLRAVLVGDGVGAFRDGPERLAELLG